jgi:GWxTD domain-containing protein
MRTILIPLCSLLLLVSCIPTSQRLYNRELRPLPPKLEVKYKLFFRQNKPYLAIAAPLRNYNLDLRAYADVEVKSQIWDKLESFKDSTSELLHLIPIELNQPSFALDIRLVNNNNQILYHDLYYANRNTNAEELIYLENTNGQAILDAHLKADQVFKIRHNSDSILNFYIKYIAESQKPAPPPYSRNSAYINAAVADYDQLFVVPMGKGIKLSQEGLYFIQTDTLSSKGYAINYFGEDYPKMTRVADLILGTRYITKNEEYDRMKNAENPKKALDEYWLARNKKPEDAKRLISLYYNRMQEANQRFTTFKEGWKTDRGIIYTIFGYPAIVRKYPDKEIWYYSHSPGRYPVEFVFLRYGQQYILERSGTLRDPWNAEILKWRVGRISN